MTSPRLRLLPGNPTVESRPRDAGRSGWSKGDDNLFHLLFEPSQPPPPGGGVLNELVGRKLALLEKLRRNDP